MILSPHTDDAELGCGGLISKLIEQGKNIYWVVFSSAKESLPHGAPEDTLVGEFKSVMDYLKLDESRYRIYDFQVRRLNEHRQDILEELVAIRKSFNPDLVIGPSLNDYHQDHIVVSNEMIRAFKTHCSIICYELPWNHLKFENQLFIELSPENIQTKLNLLECYKSQISLNRTYFSKDYIYSLAISRGGQIGKKYAEAFEVVRLKM